MADFVHTHSNLFSDVSADLPMYKNHNVTKFTTTILAAAVVVVVVVVVVTFHKF
jgi:hypothetical protein